MTCPLYTYSAEEFQHERTNGTLYPSEYHYFLATLARRTRQVNGPGDNLPTLRTTVPASQRCCLPTSVYLILLSYFLTGHVLLYFLYTSAERVPINMIARCAKQRQTTNTSATPSTPTTGHAGRPVIVPRHGCTAATTAAISYCQQKYSSTSHMDRLPPPLLSLTSLGT